MAKMQNFVIWIQTASLFIVTTGDVYKGVTEDGKTKIDTSDFETERPFPKGKNEKIVGLQKDELGGQIKKEFVRLRAKRYSCLKDNNDKDQKAKSTKKCHKRQT